MEAADLRRLHHAQRGHSRWRCLDSTAAVCILYAPMPGARGLPTLTTARIARALRAWKAAKELTQNEIASRVALSQPTVSRALRGLLTEDSPALHKLCVAAGIDPVIGTPPQGADALVTALPQSLIQAVSRVWDGSSRNAERLIALLDAVAELRHNPPALGRPPTAGMDADEERSGS